MSSEETAFRDFDPARVPSPCYVINRQELEANLQKLAVLQKNSGARILLALKAFACFPLADLIGQYLDGTAASGLYEARLGRTRFRGEVHTLAPGLKAEDLDDLLSLSDHLILNSLNQWRRLGHRLSASDCKIGLRVNPGHREVANPLYDPCAPWSRLGEPVERLTADDLAPFSSLHVHALCDHDFDAFARLLDAVEARMTHLFAAVEAINLGGGLLMTEPDFPIDRMAALTRDFRSRTGLRVYLEPGTAVVRRAGALVTQVLDTTHTGGGNMAIVDASATCHSPDVIEAPYTPDLLKAQTIPADKADCHAGDPTVWRVGGPTCLAGDVWGTYRMDRAPRPGDRLVIMDQAYYTMVKTTTFNGTPLPAIALWDPEIDEARILREFNYKDFEERLG